MNRVWSTEGVVIYDCATVSLENEEAITGLVIYKQLEFVWTAKVTPRGWQVWIQNPRSARETMWEGPTFSLLLEISAAMRQH